jgi:aryl-alcohol dehydrogenase-like predicted oxidoreductase
MPESDVAVLLNAALDAGITMFDTAPSYDLSEERLGRHLAQRRQQVVLSTKCGYGVPGVEDWTGPCITAGVDAALRRLRTDWIDVMHLHSCPLEILQRDDVLQALEGAVRAGKVRLAGYSGDNEPLQWAVASGRIRSVQPSVNLCDQAACATVLPSAWRLGIGVIAKRPLANAPWRFDEPPAAEDVRVYWERFRTMGLDPQGLAWDELALRFAAFTPGVSCCIVGTHNPGHLLRCAEIVSRGALPRDVEAGLREAFAWHGEDWRGQV